MSVFALWFGCAGSACDPAGETARSGASVVPPATHEASRAEPPRPAPRRGHLIGGERVARIPQWPPVAQIDAGVRDRASAALRAAIARSPVPVLMPADPSWLARAGLYVAEDPQTFGYAFTATRDDGDGARHLSVQASRFATLLPHIGRVRGRPVRSGEGFLSVNEGVRTASWIEHGVAYSLELECFDPEAANCDDAALRELVAGLVYVGGAAAGGAT